MYKYNYKHCIYHVPWWRSQLECGFVSQRLGFKSRDRTMCVPS